MNYHEALIKYNKQGIANLSEKNKSNGDEEIQVNRRKNLFGSNNKPTDLKTLIKKTKVIGDVDEDEEIDSKSKANRISTFTFGGWEVEAIEENEEENQEDETPLSEKIASKLYDNIVNQMVVSIINSSFHDIRIYQKLDGNLNSIVETVIRRETTNVAVETLNMLRQEQEMREKQERERQERIAEQIRQNNEAKRILLEQQMQAWLNESIYQIYDEMVKNYLTKICRNNICIAREEKRR